MKNLTGLLKALIPAFVLLVFAGAIPQASAAEPARSGAKPNILVIFGDDIGVTNISVYSDGLMGYETPNIDRIGKEGIQFLHYYGEQSCTAGRAAFLTGQHGIRTGLTKAGYPGAPMGMSQLDPSIGGLLKNLGYGTAQFGKNHVGDRNQTLPTVNGFDEFFGNLYHLNAEEEPELPDYPKDPAYRAKFGPRGVLKTQATDIDDPTVDPRFGRIGEPDIVNKLKQGYTANGIQYKVHLDGYDQSAFLRAVSGTAANNNGTKSARDKFFYADDDGLLVAMRQRDYKYIYAEQRSPGTMQVWAEPFTKLRLQKIFNLYQDPFERADITSNTFWDWQINHIGAVYGAMDEVFKFAATFKEFPPRSFPPSFVPTTIMEETLDSIRDTRREAGGKK